ncbi:MAG: tetratricopeptide repeat protein [Saprospiraceae bacterium]
MGFNNFNPDTRITELVSEYEAMSLKGTAIFFAEEDFVSLTQYYEKDSQTEQALEVLDCALEHYTYSANLLIRKARLLLDIELAESCLNILQEAETCMPSDIQIPILRAKALIMLDHLDLAESIIDELKKQSLSAVQLSKVFVMEAMIYEALEQHERVFYALQAALQEDHNNQEALERLWLCVEISKKYEESIKLNENILDINAYSYLAWYNLGHAYCYLGRYDEAIDAYEYAFLTNEKFEFAYRDCAETCLLKKNYRKALECYQEALEHFDPDADIFLRIGQCYQNLGKFEIARSFYNRSDEMESSNDEVYFHTGECYANEENWHAAIAYYLRAINIEEKREEYFAALAEAYYQQNQFDKAEPLFQRACEIAPDQTQYWIQYATFLMEAGQGERAAEVLLDAERYAVGTQLLYCRVACLFACEKRQEALYFFGEALDEDFALHTVLFDFAPNLRFDRDVQILISIYA